MVKVTVADLTAAAGVAIDLSQAVKQPIVIAGALAMAAYGYRRETSDVDIVIPVVVGTSTGDALENAARDLGLEIRAKHGFGGLDLRSGDIRIDVITLDRDVPTLIPDAVADAILNNRTMSLFGYEVYVVSLGHLISMKLVAERKKDIADIVELIKARMQSGDWSSDRSKVGDTVKAHLGWYADKEVGTLAGIARDELADR